MNREQKLHEKSRTTSPAGGLTLALRGQCCVSALRRSGKPSSLLLVAALMRLSVTSLYFLPYDLSHTALQYTS